MPGFPDVGVGVEVNNSRTVCWGVKGKCWAEVGIFTAHSAIVEPLCVPQNGRRVRQFSRAYFMSISRPLCDRIAVSRAALLSHTQLWTFWMEVLRCIMRPQNRSASRIVTTDLVSPFLVLAPKLCGWYEDRIIILRPHNLFRIFIFGFWKPDPTSLK